MARLIDASERIKSVLVVEHWKKKFYVQCFHGWRSTKYFPEDIADMRLVEEEAYRSGGKAAAGAIIGGVLTGGVGLIAGAAIGGRRRKSATVFIHFNDGAHVYFEETSSKPAKLIIEESQRRGAVAEMAGMSADKTSAI